MDAPSDIAAPAGEPRSATQLAAQATRPFYWSVRRELWENRSITLAPLVAAVVVLVGFVISTKDLAGALGALSGLDEARQQASLARRAALAAMPLLFTGFVVGWFYCLDALHGERRDRSILFWKSLPVSDAVAVLAKAAIPLVVLPIVVFATLVATQVVMLLVGTAVVAGQGESPALLWRELPLVRLLATLLYALVVSTLWHAPVYAWLLLVSGWARRAVFLWATLLPLALCVIENIGFGTSHLIRLLGNRLLGGMQTAFVWTAHDAASVGLPQIDPVHFLTTPGVWLGLLVAAAFLAAAIRQRRYREPL
ncbi:MAG TPA: ABC transporter permease [Casimicrobiaceae bacterium]|nr:ABC transporter permease [Casimicrobiaceae bacterium]